MKGEIIEKFLGEVEFRNIVFAYPSGSETIIFIDFCLKVSVRKNNGLSWW